MLESGFLRSLFETCRDGGYFCVGNEKAWEGAAWTRLPRFAHVVALWELMFDMNWLRAGPPAAMRPQHASLAEGEFWFETTLLAQARSAPERIARHQPARLVHFGWVIGGYRKFQRHGDVTGPPFRLLLTVADRRVRSRGRSLSRSAPVELDAAERSTARVVTRSAHASNTPLPQSSSASVQRLFGELRRGHPIGTRGVAVAYSWGGGFAVLYGTGHDPQEAAARAEPKQVEQRCLVEFRRWRAEVVAKSAFSSRPIPFAASREWSFVGGILRHRTGGFFALAGLAVAARTPELDGRQQLAILQPETAINGFLLRRRHGRTELLFQGRVEPGNIEAMQLAPTVQSTEANYNRLHGGDATAFLEWFTGSGGGRFL